MDPQYQVGGKKFDDWTDAQDAAVQLLDDGHEYVQVLLWDEKDEGLCFFRGTFKY